MNDEEVQIVLKRIHSDLQRVLKSRGWVQVLNATNDSLTLENSLGNALFHSCELTLKVNRIVNQIKHKGVA